MGGSTYFSAEKIYALKFGYALKLYISVWVENSIVEGWGEMGVGCTKSEICTVNKVSSLLMLWISLENLLDLKDNIYKHMTEKILYLF